MMVILQHKQVEGRNQSIGIVPGNQIHLPVFERPSNQPQIHDARRLREAQAVACDQALVSIRTLYELISKTGAPLRRKRGRLGQRLQVQAARVLAADHHGEGVVKSERWSHGEAELRFVALLHASINFQLVAAALPVARLFFENRRQRGAGIFRVDVDSSGEDCLLANERASQIEAALHGQMSPAFDDLSEQFSQNELLSEILGSNHDPVRMPFTTRDRQKQEDEQQQFADELFRVGAHGINRHRSSFYDLLSTIFLLRSSSYDLLVTISNAAILTV